MSTNPLAPQPLQQGLPLWIHAAKMSAVAYTPALWKHRMQGAGWEESDYLSADSSFGVGWAYSGSDLGILEFACAGTAGLRDLSLDLWSWFPNRWSELPRGWWVGYGMVKGPRGAWPALQDIMRSTGNRPVKEIRCWGHSKGGGEAQLCHAACRAAGRISSCVAIEPPRVFKRFARDQYRLLLDGARNDCQVIVNTKDGYRDAITAWPRTLKHGGDLNVLGAMKVYSGDEALEEWGRFKRGERVGWSPGRRVEGRFGAHGLAGVIEHLEALLETQRSAKVAT